FFDFAPKDFTAVMTPEPQQRQPYRSREDYQNDRPRYDNNNQGGGGRPAYADKRPRGDFKSQAGGTASAGGGTGASSAAYKKKTSYSKKPKDARDGGHAKKGPPRYVKK
ncbi:MAG: hypothetical protein ABIR96_10635, partial [Bdellovibrionota bacterium]